MRYCLWSVLANITNCTCTCKLIDAKLGKRYWTVTQMLSQILGKYQKLLCLCVSLPSRWCKGGRRGSPILFSWRVNGCFFLCVRHEWGFIFSVIRESIFFRPWETGFWFFRDLWKMNLLVHDLWTIDFCGKHFSLSGDFSIIKARKLHQTWCKAWRDAFLNISCPAWWMEDWEQWQQWTRRA